MNTYYPLGKVFFRAAMLIAIFAFGIFLFFAYNTSAITTTTITDNTPLFGGQKLKASSNGTAVLKVQFGSDSNGETLTSVKVTFASVTGCAACWTSGAATSSELADLAAAADGSSGIQLWKDAGAAGFQGTGVDTQVALAATPVYASGTTFIITPASAPVLVTDDIYFVVLKTKAAPTNANAFTIAVAANGDIITSASNPVITGVTSRTITIDTAAPTLNTSNNVSMPVTGATGVPIMTVPHMTFSEDVDQTTLTSANITLATTAGAVNGAIRSFPNGFDFVISNPPTYAAGSRFSKLSTVSTSFFQIAGTNPISPQGAYTAPVVGDIVITQRETFPPELGLVTDATLTSGTFAVNGFASFNSQQITKVAIPTATGLVTANTAVTAGDLIVVNTTATPTDARYNWHIVTTGAAVNSINLRLDSAGAAPAYVSSSRFSTITPNDTSAVNGSSAVVGTANNGIDFVVGDLVFAKVTAGGDNLNSFAWHVVTTAQNITTDIAPTTLRLDGASVAPTFVANSQVSKLTPAATDAVTDAVTVFALGDIVMAKTTGNAGNNNAYNFHIVNNGATGANSTSLRFDNVPGNLANSTAYTLTMGTGIKDSAGNAYAGGTVTFTTGSTGGTNITPPGVQSSQPSMGNQTYPISAPIKLTFSVDMASSGGGSVTSDSNIGLFLDNFGAPGVAVTTTKAYDSASKTVTLTPTALTASTGYMVKVNPTVTSTTGAALNNGMGPYFLSFKTASGTADVAAPTVLGVNPANAATGAALGTVVTAGFSEDINPATLTASTVTLSGGITGTVTYNPQSRSVSFAPSTALTADTVYTFTIVGGGSDPRVKDLSGNALAANYTSTFRTTATADSTKPLLTFANADNFSVAVTFSESVKSGGGPNAADNIANFTLESPVGSSISLGGKTVTYEAGTKTARITGLSLQNGNTYKITVAPVVQDLAGNVMRTTEDTPPANTQFGTVADSTTTGGQIGPGGGTIDMSMQGMNPSRVIPMSRGAGATSNYHIEFLGSASIPATGQIVLTFPSGFTLASAAAVSTTNSFCNADLNGPMTGAPVIDTVVGNNDAGTVTITTTAAAATGANAFLCMDLSGIVNSTVPSSAGYTVTIQTKNTAALNRATLQNITTAPFFLGTAGSRTLTVNVFKDAGSPGNGTNDDGEGIDGVTVYLFSPATGGQEATTATVSSIEGIATFANLADGDYMIGIKPTAAINVAFNSMPQPFTVSASTLTKNFALSNAVAKTISGTITVPVGLNGTKVDVFASSPNGFTKKTITLVTGSNNYSLPVSINTSYNVGVGPYIPESFFTPGSTPPPPPDFTFMPPPNVQVNVGSDSVNNTTVAGLAFTLSSASKTITGTVVDSSGTGVSGAGIFCRPVAASTTSGASGFGTGAQSNTSGAFTVKVTEGVYLCGVFKPGMPPVAEKQITVGALANTPATLAFVLDVATTLTITGTIKDDSGNAIPYAGVSGRKVVSTSNTTAMGGDSGNFVGGPTDANGAYTLYVSAGTWVVEAFAPGFGRLGTKTITITTSSSSGQDFSAQTLAMGTITGTATQATTPVQGVMVRAENADATSGNMAVTGSDGTYTLKVPAGTYSLICYFPGVGEGTPVTGVIVTAGNTTSNKHCTQAAPITITVNVTDGTNAITNAGIEVRDSNGRGNFTSTSTTTGANAVYTIVVPPGTYTVRAGHPAYGSIGTTSNVSTTQAITYNVGGTKQLYAVTGTVTGDGSNLSGAWVSLNGTPTGQTNTVFLGAQTASNGTFSINVPPGVYRVRADKPGYKSPAETIATVTTATLPVGTIALTTAARTITGTITVDNSGVSNAFVDATDGNGGYAVAQTNASGVYTLNVDNGTWTIRAHSMGYEGGPLPVVVNSNSPSGQNLALTAISGFTIKAERPETITPTTGGFLTNNDIGSNFQMEIPANALGTGSNAATVTTKINTAMPNPPSGTILNKNAVSIDAVDSAGSPISSLNDEITITIPYTEADLPSGTTEASLVIGVWNDANQTYDTLSTTVDTTLNTLTATVSHLSDFAPLVASGGTPPSTPTGFAVANASTNASSSLALSWTVVSGATGYDIYRSSTADGTYARLGSEPTVSSGATVTYTDTGLSEYTSYYYKISALTNSEESAATSYQAGTTARSTTGGSSTGGGAPSGGAAAATTTPETPVTTATPAVPGEIPGCGNRTTGFSTTTSGLSCVGNTSTTPATPATPSSGSASSSSSSSTGSGKYKLGTATLKNGSKGEAVKELQRFLNDKLDLGLALDGMLGPKTITVIKKWQKDNGLKADGLIGAKTKAMMNADTTATPAIPASPSTTTGSYNLGTTTLKNGSRGEAVKELQRFLNDKLDLGLALDGVLGPKTISVIKKWQKDNGLKADGLIGAKTKAMMNAE